MDLALSESQEMLKNLTRDFFENEFPPKLLRDIEADDDGYSSETWRKMTERGHFFGAIDIASFRPVTEFKKDMDKLLGELRTTPSVTLRADPGTARRSDPGFLPLSSGVV